MNSVSYLPLLLVALSACHTPIFGYNGRRGPTTEEDDEDVLAPEVMGHREGIYATAGGGFQPPQMRRVEDEHEVFDGPPTEYSSTQGMKHYEEGDEVYPVPPTGYARGYPSSYPPGFPYSPDMKRFEEGGQEYAVPPAGYPPYPGMKRPEGEEENEHKAKIISVTKRGEVFVVDYKKDVEDDGTCTETIEIKGQPDTKTKNIHDSFHPDCKKDIERPMFYAGDEVLVGSVDQNILVYGHKDMPDRLIELGDSDCKVRAYGKGSKIEVKDIDDKDCEKIKKLLKEIQKVLELPVYERKGDNVLKNSQEQLNDLAMSLGPPAQTIDDSDTETIEKRKSLLLILWIAIKNICRIIVGKPIKDE